MSYIFEGGLNSTPPLSRRTPLASVVGSSR